MPQSKRKSDKHRLNYREFSVRASSVNEEERSIEADVSTETAVLEFDWERWEYVPRVLLASGAQFPRTNQVPLLDNHQRWSISSQLGSARDVEKRNDRVSARLVFSASAEDEWTKVREGHVTDVSAGFRILKETHVAAGKSRKIRGKTYEGPINVATSWRLGEVSITPIGADDQAKMRGLDPAKLPKVEGFTMNEELRALLIERGMNADLDDDAAQAWMIENKERVFSKDNPVPEPTPEPVPEPSRSAGNDGANGDGTPTSVDKAVNEALARRETERQQFRSDVDMMIKLADVDDANFTRELYDQPDIDHVRDAILKHKEDRSVDIPAGAHFSFGAAQADKHRGALSTAIFRRSFESCGVAYERQDDAWKRMVPEPAEGWEQFRYASLADLARECLVIDGYNQRDLIGLSREQIAIAALGFPHQTALRNTRSNPGYHITGSFSVLTQDAVNKSMMLGYGEYPSTWRGPMRQGSSVSDFKTIHRMQLGAVPQLPIWDGKTSPNEASMKDDEETYAVECRSLKLSFSYKLLVNDDMDVIGRSPFKMGDAAARTVNIVAWAQITSNPTMRDSQVLFLETAAGNRQRSNLTTGAGTPSTATIQTLSDKMMQMRGVNTPAEAESDDILGLMPRYICGPSALRSTILQVVRSIADPDGTHAGVANINNNLIPVIEPLLDANSATAWYLGAEPTRVETVEVTFLQGQEQPATREYVDEETLARHYIILQTFAAKALDHRGLQRHDGV